MTLLPGAFYELEVKEISSEGIKLDHQVILALKEKLPEGIETGHMVHVFVYADSEGRLWATFKKPKGCEGDIVKLRVVDANKNGAFMDWGIPKDLFLPRSLQVGEALEPGDETLVRILRDERSGKLLASERESDMFSNESLTVKEREVVELIAWRKTDLGYQVIINGRHMGLLHYNEVFRKLELGEKFTGFIKKLKPDGKIDVMIGKPGHARVFDESDKIITMLKEKEGFLPYHDKSDAQEIYRVFGMSKKTFKMILGGLYREGMISLQPDGIRLLPRKRK